MVHNNPQLTLFSGIETEGTSLRLQGSEGTPAPGSNPLGLHGFTGTPAPGTNPTSDIDSELGPNSPLQQANQSAQAALRLTKIAQQLSEYNQAIDADLLQSIWEDLKKYSQQFAENGDKNTSNFLATQADKKNYSPDSLEKFKSAGIALHRNSQVTTLDTTNNSFTIHRPNVPNEDPVTVQFTRTPKINDKGEEVPENFINRIAISGNQSNIDTMLVAILRTKKRIGEKAKLVIYPSDDMEAVAELCGKAQGLGIKIDFKPKSNSEADITVFNQFIENKNNAANFTSLSKQHQENIKKIRAENPRIGDTAKHPPNPPEPENSEGTPPAVQTGASILATTPSTTAKPGESTPTLRMPDKQNKK
jgi:hypothetical protein